MGSTDPIQAFLTERMRGNLVSATDLQAIWRDAFPRRAPPLSVPPEETYSIPAETTHAFESSWEYQRQDTARRALLQARQNGPRAEVVKAYRRAAVATQALERLAREIEIRHRPVGALTDALWHWVECRRRPLTAFSRAKQLKHLRELQDTSARMLSLLNDPVTDELFRGRFGHHFLFESIDVRLGEDPHGGLSNLLEEARQLVLYDERFQLKLAHVAAASRHYARLLSDEPRRPGPRKDHVRHDFVVRVVEIFEALARRPAKVSRTVTKASANLDDPAAGLRSGPPARFLAAICRLMLQRLGAAEVSADPKLKIEVSAGSTETVAGQWIEAGLEYRDALRRKHLAPLSGGSRFAGSN